MTFDPDGGTQIIRGKTGNLQLKVAGGTFKKCYVQDWALQNQFDNKDVKPMGFQGDWKIPDDVKSSGSSKFIFRRDSEALRIFTKTFADVIEKVMEGSAPASSSTADPTVEITLRLFKSRREWYEVDIIIESINDGLSVGNFNTFDVSWSVKGKPTYTVLTGTIIDLDGPEEVAVDADITLTPTLEGAPDGYTLVWTSSAPAKATVADGVVTGVATGTTVITCDVKDGADTVGTTTFEVTVVA